MMYRVAMYLIQDFFATLCCRKLIPRMAAIIKSPCCYFEGY